MLKSVWCVSCLMVLLFPMFTLAAGTKIICEGDAIPECYKKKAGVDPVARPNCPTTKGWVIIHIKDCGPGAPGQRVENGIPFGGGPPDAVAGNKNGKGKYK